MTDGVIVPLPVEPHVIHKGFYTLWQKPDGGMRIQYKRDDKDQEDFIDMPGEMVELAKLASEGKLSLPEMMKRTIGLFSRMK